MLSAAFSTSHNRKVMDVLTDLGLTSGLRLCLDAGDIASWPGSGTKWLDVSGGGYDFTITGATFSGAAGSLSGSKWSLDGGDYFTYDTTNETWMENLHKNNQSWSIATWFYFPADATGATFHIGDAANTPANRGLMLYQAQGDARLYMRIFNGSGAAYYSNFFNSSEAKVGAWNFLGFSATISSGTLTININCNSRKSDSVAQTTSGSPSSSAASSTFSIENGFASGITSAGAARGMTVMWNTALTSAQFESIKQATRSRF